MAVIRLTHRICTAVTGKARPASSASTTTIDSPAFVGSVQLITFLRLS